MRKTALILLLTVFLSVSFGTTEEEFATLLLEEDEQTLLSAIPEIKNINELIFDRYHMSPLMYAVEQDASPAVIEALLKAGADPNALDGDGWTALTYAFWLKSSPEIIKLLINAGTDVNAGTYKGKSALASAITGRYSPEIIELLVEKGADVNFSYNGEPLLITALRSNNPVEVIRILLDSGAYPDKKAFGYVTAEEQIITLLSYGTDPDAEVNGKPLLLEAMVQESDSQTINLIIECGADVNATDEDGYTSLMYAIGYGYPITIIQSLIDKGADLQAVDSDGYWSVMTSALWSNNSEETVKELLKAGIVIGEADEDALFYAIGDSYQPETVRQLIEAGADPDYRDYDDESVLLYAIKKGCSPEILQILLEAGADVNAFYRGAPVWARCKKKADFELMLSYGADLDISIDGLPLLLFGLSEEVNPEIIKLCVENGADVNVNDTKGQTALMYAVRNYDSIDLVEYLISKGADVDAKTKDGYSSVYAAIQLSDDLDLVLLLLNNSTSDSDMSIRNADGSTVLKTAIMRFDSPELIQQLINRGADVNARSDTGVSPLMYAAKSSEKPEIIKALIDAGANVNSADQLGRTPLMYAIDREYNPDILKLLLDNKANAYKEDLTGCTALLHALEKGRDEAAKAIIASGADINRPMSSGRTLLEQACATNHFEYLPLLSKLGADFSILADIDSVLLSAVRLKADADAIQTLLDAGADANAKDISGMTPLLLAATNDDPSVLALLDKKGANTGERNTNGETALLAAIKSGASPAVIQVLLNAEADVYARDYSGKSVFDYLLKQKPGYRSETIPLLLSAGADIDTPLSSGKTMLTLAYENNNDKDFIALLQLGADPDQDYNGATLLLDSTKNNRSPEKIKALLDAGASVYAKGENDNTPLLYAARFTSYPEVIRMLLDANAYIFAENSSRWDPVSLAASFNKNPDVLKALLENWKSSFLVNNALLNAAHRASAPAIIQALLDAGADVDVTSKNIAAVEFAARENPNPDIFKVLVLGGASINIASQDDSLMYMKKALDTNSYEVLEAVINAGADPEAIAYGKTMLMYALGNQADDEIIRCLIRNGTDSSFRDKDGKDAVFYAVENNYSVEVIRLLLSSGGSVSARTIDGKTALMQAAGYGDRHTVKALIDAGANVNATDDSDMSVLMYATRYNDKEDVIHTLLDAGADATMTNGWRSAIDYIDKSSPLYKSQTWWLLHDAEY